MVMVWAEAKAVKDNRRREKIKNDFKRIGERFCRSWQGAGAVGRMFVILNLDGNGPSLQNRPEGN